jgi:hypothetical protein
MYKLMYTVDRDRELRSIGTELDTIELLDKIDTGRNESRKVEDGKLVWR